MKQRDTKVYESYNNVPRNLMWKLFSIAEDAILDFNNISSYSIYKFDKFVEWRTTLLNSR